jgi:glyoxylase-like metal-dependent hydrolase (beta-lactamase superfamily II)
MTTLRILTRLIAPTALALGVVATDAAAQTAPLTLQVYNADANSFHVNAVLVAGKTDAVLLDTGFTRADALRIAAMVLDSKKALKTIFITQADPTTTSASRSSSNTSPTRRC